MDTFVNQHRSTLGESGGARVIAKVLDETNNPWLTRKIMRVIQRYRHDLIQIRTITHRELYERLGVFIQDDLVAQSTTENYPQPIIEHLPVLLTTLRRDEMRNRFGDTRTRQSA